MQKNPEFPAMLEAFFTDRLMRQRQASPHTIASYCDTFRLLLKFAKEMLKKCYFYRSFFG
jgi:site-specific recombinase XerC